MNFYLIEAVNKKIEILVAAGLVEFWQIQDVDTKYLRLKETTYPMPLNFTHLKGSFYFLFMGLFAGFVAFIYELFKNEILKIQIFTLFLGKA